VEWFIFVLSNKIKMNNITLITNSERIKNLKIAICNANTDVSDLDLFIAMNRSASETKGFHFVKVYKSFSYEVNFYIIQSDYDTLVTLSKQHGYWSSLVQDFNQKLIHKGGIEYKNELNNKYLASLK